MPRLADLFSAWRANPTKNEDILTDVLNLAIRTKAYFFPAV